MRMHFPIVFARSYPLSYCFHMRHRCVPKIGLPADISLEMFIEISIGIFIDISIDIFTGSSIDIVIDIFTDIFIDMYEGDEEWEEEEWDFP